MYFLLTTIIICELAYIVYQDFLNRKERADLQLKLMSKDVREYKEVKEKAPKDAESDPTPYVDLSDVSFKELKDAEVNL